MTLNSNFSCFQCSLLLPGDSKICPTSTDDYNVWKTKKGAFTKVIQGEVCSVLVSGETGKVYHQGSIYERNCISSEETMKRQVASKFRDATAKLECCSNNGCNWNGTTANMTGGGGNIDTGYTVTSNNLVVAEDNTLAAAMGFIVIGLVLLVLLLFLCFLLYKRQKTAEQKNEAVQATANKTMYNERFVTNKQYSEFDRLSNKNSLGGQYPISRNSTKISVREAETDFMADKWRSHSMAVPPRIEPPPGPKISKPKRDWQDVGIERRNGGGFERKNDGYDNYGHKKSTESSNFDWRSDDSSDYGPNQIDRSRNTVIRQEQNKIQYFNNQKLKEEDSSDDEKEGGKAKRKTGWQDVYPKDKKSVEMTRGNVNPFVFTEDLET